MTKRERLIELLQEYTDNNNGGGSNHGRADHLLANGVIVPPCKVGDTVYSCLGKAYQVTKMDIKICSKHITFLLKSGLNGELICDDSDFGKTVFRTKEEAEKALAEREQK